MTVWTPGVVIDVSKWQDSLPSLTGVIGVIARAGIGTKPDAMFTSHIAAARAAGKWVGSYWYNWGDLTVSQQVDAYIAREQAVGGVSLHAIDWEGVEGFTSAQTADFIRIYKARTGDPIALYASEGRFRDLGQDWNWIANYSQEPQKQYDMWQYGPFRGVDGNHATPRILDLVRTAQQPEGPTDTMRSFEFDDSAVAGDLTVNGPNHLYLDLETNLLKPIADGTPKRGFGLVRLTEGGITGPTDPRNTGYLINQKAAFILASDAKFNPDVAADCSAVEAELAEKAEEVNRLTALVTQQTAALDIAAPKAQALDELVAAHKKAGLDS